MTAFALDEALAMVDDIAEAWARERASKPAAAEPPEGLRWVTEADYADDEEAA